jgi:enoyl-CoA hydratase/carnithine racemase
MYTIRMQHAAKNALGNDLMGWLESEIRNAGEQPIFLTGTADSFSAGLNLRELASFDDAAMERFLRRMDDLAVKLFLHPAPTVAFVNGHAIAGGCVLASCCDWRVAAPSPKTRIGVNEVAIGACFPPSILKIMLNRLSSSVREQVLLGATLHDVERALALGLIDEIGDEQAAWKRLQGLAGYPRSTFAATKYALRHGLTDWTSAEERRFREREVPIWSSPEMKSRVMAVLERK